jgi:Xaa-Pro aminopeptidase
MEENGIDVLIAVSDTRHNEHQGDVRYITNFNFWCPPRPYSIMTSEAGPVLVVGMPSEAYWAAASDSWADEVSWAPSPIEEVVSSIRRMAGEAGRIGVSGLKDLMPLHDYERLKQAFPRSEIVDATALLARARSIKGDEELRAMQESALIAREAYGALAGRLRSGETETSLAREVEQVARSRGATDILILTSPGPYLRPPTDREVGVGDFQMFSLELSGPSGYWAEVGGMLALGTMSGADTQLLEVCRDAFDHGAKLLTPGSVCSDVAESVREFIVSSGYALGIWGGHGIGLEIAEHPPIVGSNPTELEDGMVFGFHPHVVDPQTQHAAYLSDTLCVSDGGGVPVPRGITRPVLIQAEA